MGTPGLVEGGVAHTYEVLPKVIYCCIVKPGMDDHISGDGGDHSVRCSKKSVWGLAVMSGEVYTPRGGASGLLQHVKAPLSAHGLHLLHLLPAQMLSAHFPRHGNLLCQRSSCRHSSFSFVLLTEIKGWGRRKMVAPQCWFTATIL